MSVPWPTEPAALAFLNKTKPRSFFTAVSAYLHRTEKRHWQVCTGASFSRAHLATIFLSEPLFALADQYQAEFDRFTVAVHAAFQKGDAVAFSELWKRWYNERLPAIAEAALDRIIMTFGQDLRRASWEVAVRDPAIKKGEAPPPVPDFTQNTLGIYEAVMAWLLKDLVIRTTLDTPAFGDTQQSIRALELFLCSVWTIALDTEWLRCCIFLALGFHLPNPARGISLEESNKGLFALTEMLRVNYVCFRGMSRIGGKVNARVLLPAVSFEDPRAMSILAQASVLPHWQYEAAFTQESTANGKVGQNLYSRLLIPRPEPDERYISTLDEFVSAGWRPKLLPATHLTGDAIGDGEERDDTKKLLEALRRPPFIGFALPSVPMPKTAIVANNIDVY
jgi:hypothetical protein